MYKNENSAFLTILALLLLKLSPLLVLDCVSLCNTNTRWNILTILGRNVEQEELTCCIQE